MSEEPQLDEKITDAQKGRAGKVNPKDQAAGVLLLLIVAAGLWAFLKIVPAQLDRLMGGLTGGNGAGIESPEKELPAAPAGKSHAAAVVKEIPLSLESAGRQIVEQLGGAGKVELRHLAFSDDGSRLAAALKESGEGGQLFEMIFERDEFGRFVADHDSGGQQLHVTIWPQ